MTSENQKKQDEAIEKIEEYIIEYRLKPKDKLPSERMMQKLWGFNRTTLRSAIRYLTMTGILYAKSGSGTYIANKKLVKCLEDSKGTYQVALESGRKITNKVLEFTKIKSGEEISRKMKIELGVPIYKLVRLRYLDGIPFTYSKVYLDASICNNLEDFDFVDNSLYEILKNNFDVKISGGEEHFDIIYSDDYESSLFEIPKNSPLIYQIGITFNEREEIFEYFKEITRSEYVLFTGELRRNDKTSAIGYRL